MNWWSTYKIHAESLTDQRRLACSGLEIRAREGVFGFGLHWATCVEKDYLAKYQKSEPVPFS
jgi:hypothetical protein